ncbi:hypothetical protein A3F07_01810 [candidate division WWE3 bacterium RIFCSPHIGHO2_12_FULL_38_15]|uniref:Glycosyltransferase RgtA/B/C/D-like domain-containing protein n=1 Tax=candidate division WWE3 bacterium RIFCSPHIGHO2_02_FULL_38_14 TaxID=1802620 RepID=A0A1F4VB04_UNCKA|nr:MAG: hypothetical protein A2793_00475 [candidate division WWE3 bacterium RIFCSPHIGHO2_01_FULL_38_45]OGC48439.1 MAG: hypothetical protein A3F07_01810 [candidate division WWE3 bacterium RIFCSPHIGHO2_12_FULL_38_15]OGC52870.1 MAG: hypothetical protein A3B64_03585 [candidate division WWE3 bacterium RIFCSPLOWO2_01_FULL_37_24]OGC54374.1 MAG: hypothetical protein A3D91_00560 [candidate division WWE3 bacterium RIFCSPHIGHO2_02_FULL_38_14]HLB51617.1 glycosyltransferase family 39 protein [Patescibacteri
MSQKINLIMLPKIKHEILIVLLFFAAVIFSFFLRIQDLNYNSAFGEEAVYVIVGKMGIFYRDWHTFNSFTWMGGLPYLYPVLSALAYENGGIYGSRLLNVFLSLLVLEELYRFTLNINLFGRKKNIAAALISVFLVGFSPIAVFLNTLATFDVLALLFFLLSINSLLIAHTYKGGKYYFVSSISLVLSVLTNYFLVLLLPFVLYLSLKVYKKLNTGEHKNLMKTYYYITVFSIIGAFIIFNLTFITTFARTQIVDDMELAKKVLSFLWKNDSMIVVLIVLVMGFIYEFKKNQVLFFSFLLSTFIIFVHVILGNVSSLAKHLYIVEVFTLPCAAYLFVYIYSLNKPAFKVISGIAITSIFIYYIFNYQYILNHLRKEWLNTSDTNSYLTNMVKYDSRVLSESGATTILSLFNIVDPTNVSTFEWFNYSNLQGSEAYAQAVADGYFNLIELSGTYTSDPEIAMLVRQNMGSRYVPVYKKDSFEIYERTK